LVASRFQLLLQLVEEAPIGSVIDELLRGRFDYSTLVQAKRMKADSVLGFASRQR
jgi:hypothetical protein